MHRWSNDELAKIEAEHRALAPMIALIKTVRDDVRAHYECQIEAIIGEFGDDPTACLQIIAHDIELAQHYRAHPKAERVD